MATRILLHEKGVAHKEIAADEVAGSTSVGESDTGNVFGVWTDGAITALPLPVGSLFGTASDINNNDAGQVVGGFAAPGRAVSHQFVWQKKDESQRNNH